MESCLRGHLVAKIIRFCDIMTMERKALPQRIEGDRIVLEKNSVLRASEIFKRMDHDRERLRQFLPWVDSTKEVSDTETFIRNSDSQWLECRLFNYSILRKADDIYLGNLGVLNIDWFNEKCELGYWIGTPYEGLGLMTEALEVIEKILFKTGFHRLEIRCLTENKRSARVAEKVGYCFEGKLRGVFLFQGEHRDGLLYAKLRTDRSDSTSPA